MTKAEKNIIITAEAELWRDYQRELLVTALEHERNEFPNCYAFEDWAQDNCPEVKSTLRAWGSVWSLLLSLKLQSDYESEAHEIAKIYQRNLNDYFQK